MNECYNMVTYDQWSYMTLLVTLQVVFATLDGGIQIDRLFVACENPRGTGELAGKWFFNRMPSDGGKGPVSDLDIMAQTSKRIGRNAYGW